MIGTAQLNGFVALLSFNFSWKRSEAIAGVNDAVPAVRVGKSKKSGVLPCSLIYVCLMSWQCV